MFRELTLRMERGEAWGVLGPSGAGKTTLLRLVLGLTEPDEGRIEVDGLPWSPLAESARRDRRWRIQAVLQEARASLPPHRTGWQLLEDPLEAWGRGDAGARREAAARMAQRVRFPEAALSQRPGAWSGGMAQRLCLGRALMLKPELLVLDEPLAAVDPTVGSHLLGLLQEIQAAGTALLVASHDRTALDHLCRHLLVLDAGKVVAQGPVARLRAERPELLRPALEGV